MHNWESFNKSWIVIISTSAEQVNNLLKIITFSNIHLTYLLKYLHRLPVINIWFMQMQMAPSPT